MNQNNVATKMKFGILAGIFLVSVFGISVFVSNNGVVTEGEEQQTELMVIPIASPPVQIPDEPMEINPSWFENLNVRLPSFDNYKLSNVAQGPGPDPGPGPGPGPNQNDCNCDIYEINGQLISRDGRPVPVSVNITAGMLGMSNKMDPNDPNGIDYLFTTNGLDYIDMNAGPDLGPNEHPITEFIDGDPQGEPSAVVVLAVFQKSLYNSAIPWNDTAQLVNNILLTVDYDLETLNLTTTVPASEQLIVVMEWVFIGCGDYLVDTLLMDGYYDPQTQSWNPLTTDNYPALDNKINMSNLFELYEPSMQSLAGGIFWNSEPSFVPRGLAAYEANDTGRINDILDYIDYDGGLAYLSKMTDQELVIIVEAWWLGECACGGPNFEQEWHATIWADGYFDTFNTLQNFQIDPNSEQFDGFEYNSVVFFEHQLNQVMTEGMFPPNDVGPPYQMNVLGVFNKNTFDWNAPQPWDQQTRNYFQWMDRDPNTDQEIFNLRSDVPLANVQLVLIIEYWWGTGQRQPIKDEVVSSYLDEFGVNQSITTVGSLNYIDLNLIPDYDPLQPMIFLAVFANATYNYTLGPQAQLDNNLLDYLNETEGFLYLYQSTADNLVIWMLFWECKVCATVSVGIMWQDGEVFPDGTIDYFKAEQDRLYVSNTGPQGSEPHVKQFEFNSTFGFGGQDQGPLFEIIGIWVDDPASPHQTTYGYDWNVDAFNQPKQDLFDWWGGWDEIRQQEFIQLKANVNGAQLIIVVELFAVQRDIIGSAVIAHAGFQDPSGENYFTAQGGRLPLNFGNEGGQENPIFVAMAGDMFPLFDVPFVDMGASFLGIYKLSEYNSSMTPDMNNPEITSAFNYLDTIDFFSGNATLLSGVTDGERMVIVTNMTFLAPCDCELSSIDNIIDSVSDSEGFGVDSQFFQTIQTTPQDASIIHLDHQTLHYLPGDGLIVDVLGVFNSSEYNYAESADNQTIPNLFTNLLYNMSGVWIQLNQTITDDLVLWMEFSRYLCDCNWNSPPEWDYGFGDPVDIIDIPLDAIYSVNVALWDPQFNGLEIELWVNNTPSTMMFVDTILWEPHQSVIPINLSRIVEDYLGYTPGTRPNSLNVSVIARDWCNSTFTYNFTVRTTPPIGDNAAPDLWWDPIGTPVFTHPQDIWFRSNETIYSADVKINAFGGWEHLGGFTSAGSGRTDFWLYLDTFRFPDGPYEIQVTVSDNFGNTATYSFFLNIENDRIPPIITTNISSTAMYHGVVLFEVTSSEGGWGNVFIDDRWVARLEFASTAYFELNTNMYQDGLHRIWIEAEDYAMNRIELFFDINIDNTFIPDVDVYPPHIEVNVTANTVYSGILYIEVTSNESGSGQAELDNQVIGLLTFASSDIVKINTSEYTDGLHALFIKAEDEAGNVGEFRLDLTFENGVPPTSTDTEPTDTETSTPSDTFTSSPGFELLMVLSVFILVPIVFRRRR